eukprot:6208807-Lingulodinium_polyedra.AAC.1
MRGARAPRRSNIESTGVGTPAGTTLRASVRRGRSIAKYWSRNNFSTDQLRVCTQSNHTSAW